MKTHTMKQPWSSLHTVYSSAVVVFFLLFYGNSDATLIVNATVVCPNDTIIFTCSLPGDNVTWEVYTPPGFNIALRLVVSEAQPTTTSADLRLEGAVTDFSRGRITATLTVISFGLGYGTTVACIGQDTLSSADILTITRPDPPSAPGNLTWTADIVPALYSTITLTWDHTPQQDVSVSYIITISPPPPFGLPSTVETTFVVINVSYNTQYNVTVRAVNCAGSSDALAVISVDIGNCTVPIEPTNGTIIATLVDGTTVDYDSLSNTVLEGTVLTYQCGNGLALFGSVNITCTSDGEWSSDPDLVECSNCTVPEFDVELTGATITATLVDGTTVDYDSLNNEVLEGTVLTYQCDNGLTLLFGSVNITCTSGGEWSSDPDRNRCYYIYGSAGFSVVSIIVFIILFVVLSWIMVSFGIYKRRKRLRKQRLATTVLRHDLAALPANSYDPLRFNRGTMESTLSSDQCPSESETTPRYYRISRTSQVSFTDNRQSSISEPPIAIDDAREEPTTVNSTELPPETVPQFPTTGPTAQVSATDGHYSSISEPSIAIDDSREESTANKTSTGTGTASTAGTSVEEVSSAIANAWSLILGNVMKLPDLSESLKIPGSQLKLSSDPIGQGETGMVYKGLLMNWKDEPLQAVAVKTLKGLFSSSDIQFLMSEIIKMKDFNHPHVMPLIGVCLDAGPGVSMVMPHMTNGSVLDYLKKERSGLKLTDNCSKEKAQSVRKLLLRMCHQIALGMEYLSQQRFIHRDLAARNCMLDSSGDVRVGDFGLAEDVYSTGYFRQNERADIKLPYKWMALESLNDAIFTEKTDVWSYGVTMWEVFSGGQIPYPGVDVRTLVKFLQRGNRLDAPVNTACTAEISAVMQRCWLEDYEERPSFTDLSSIMDAMLSSVSDYAELNMELPHNSQDPIDMSGYDDLNESLRNRVTRTDQ
ncbi:uncharacterized protein LOC135337903 isoform X2 [Halichondria panicea]|uniref:uncharacterized protein LOC135337903 isoform X2 n=1 Tax=Halichondria panicea TaxID=6063 RepID=UPI00312BAACA